MVENLYVEKNIEKVYYRPLTEEDSVEIEMGFIDRILLLHYKDLFL